MNPIYSLENVSKAYDGRCVLNIQRLDVYPGEILGIIGPSGAGKSTLLRLLDFLELPTGGTITFGAGAYHTNGTPPPLSVRRRVTMVFQRPLLLSRSVADNVAYGLRLRSQNHVRSSVQSMLERVGLVELAGAPARSLSGGEAQRVAVARALVIDPEVLLLDEPTANLDPANVKSIETIVREANERHGTTIVLVTHNIFQARRLAHRVAFLLDGRLVEVGTTEQIFESPTMPQTAAFVRGEMVY